MIKIIDTFAQINNLFEDGKFILDKWKEYMNSIYDNTANLVIDDMKECFGNGDYVYEKDILPIITAVYKHADLEILHSSFCKVTEGLNKKVNDCFGNEVDIDIVLYVGLCNGAGWVTNINGRDVILLGVEKILELNWVDEAIYSLKEKYNCFFIKGNKEDYWLDYQANGEMRWKGTIYDFRRL